MKKKPKPDKPARCYQTNQCGTYKLHKWFGNYCERCGLLQPRKDRRR